MSAVITSVTTATNALKILYSDRRLKKMAYEKSPLLALLPKMEKFQGLKYNCAIWYGGNASGSRDFATAKDQKRPGKYEQFEIVRRKDYNLVSLETEAILAAQGAGAAAFLDLAKGEIESTVDAVSRNQAISLYGNKGGARGQIGAISSTALTLVNKADVVKFEVGMVLVEASTDGTSGSLTANAEAEITAIDRRDGILYASAWTNFVQNSSHYLFRKGDFGVSFDGLEAWIPTTAPVAGVDDFNGVDRGTDTRLYGQYHDGSNQSIEEAIQDLDTKLFIEGGRADLVLMHPTDVNSYRKSLGSNVVYDKVKSPDMASVSFTSIKLQSLSSDGAIDIVPDALCPAGTFYMLQKNSWEFCSLGGAPRVLDVMGQKYIWDTSTDSIEARVGSYANLACHAPGFNGKGKLY